MISHPVTKISSFPVHKNTPLDNSRKGQSVTQKSLVFQKDDRPKNMGANSSQHECLLVLTASITNAYWY
jgi:hypothetical protein